MAVLNFFDRPRDGRTEGRTDKAQWAVLGGQEGGSLFDTKSLNNLLMCYGLSFVSIRHA